MATSRPTSTCKHSMFDPLIGNDQVGMASSLLGLVSVLRIGLTGDAGMDQGCMQPSC